MAIALGCLGGRLAMEGDGGGWVGVGDGGGWVGVGGVTLLNPDGGELGHPAVN
jgi:hypothetical protein